MYKLTKLSDLEKQIYICLFEIIFTRIIARYLQKVALQQRPLTFLENFVITVALYGMAVSQIFSFFIMDYRLTTEDEIIALGILNFAVASRNLYSCMMRPKTANPFLEKIKTEMAATRENSMEEAKKHHEEKTNAGRESLRELEDRFAGLIQRRASEAEISDTKSKIAEQHETIEKLQLDFIGANRRQLDAYEKDLEVCRQRIKEAREAGDENRVAELKENETFFEKKIQQYTTATEQNQQQFLDDKGDAMQNEKARQSYFDFVEKAQEETPDTNAKINQNDRIIRAVTSMDAERVFGLVAKTESTVRFAFGLVANTESTVRFPDREDILSFMKSIVHFLFRLVTNTESTIRFADGKDIISHFNKEFRVHPSALEQMNKKVPTGQAEANREQAETNREQTGTDMEQETYLKRVLEHTREFKVESKTKQDTENYRCKIKVLLDGKDGYRFISDTEIDEFVKELKEKFFTPLTDEQKDYFRHLNPEKTYRLRTVVKDTSYEFNSKTMQAAVKLAEKRGVTSNPREIANCIETIKVHVTNKVREAKIEAEQRKSPEKLTRARKNEIRTQAINDLLPENSTAMNDLDKDITEKIKLIKRYSKGTKKYDSDLSAYYHTEKHGRDTLKVYHWIIEESMPEDDPAPEKIYEIYHRKMPKKITEKVNLQFYRIAQYGQTKKHTYKMNIPKIKKGKFVRDTEGKTLHTVYNAFTVFKRIPTQDNWNYQNEPWSDDEKIASHFDTHKVVKLESPSSAPCKDAFLVET